MKARFLVIKMGFALMKTGFPVKKTGFSVRMISKDFNWFTTERFISSHKNYEPSKLSTLATLIAMSVFGRVS